MPSYPPWNHNNKRNMVKKHNDSSTFKRRRKSKRDGVGELGEHDSQTASILVQFSTLPRVPSGFVAKVSDGGRPQRDSLFLQHLQSELNQLKVDIQGLRDTSATMTISNGCPGKNENTVLSDGYCAATEGRSEIPCFEETIWPILKSVFGFRCGADGYTHPALQRRDRRRSTEPTALRSAKTNGKAITFSRPSDLAKYLYWNPFPGIPPIGSSSFQKHGSDSSSTLSTSQRDAITDWLKFAYVPGALDEAHFHEKLTEGKFLEDDDACVLLVQVGFILFQGNVFLRPGVLENEIPEDQFVFGVHKFDGLEEVRSFVRGTENIRFTSRMDKFDSGDSSKTRISQRILRKTETGKESDIRTLRIWAAYSIAPIPFFFVPSHIFCCLLDERSNLEAEVSSLRNKVKSLENQCRIMDGSANGSKHIPQSRNNASREELLYTVSDSHSMSPATGASGSKLLPPPVPVLQQQEVLSLSPVCAPTSNSCASTGSKARKEDSRLGMRVYKYFGEEYGGWYWGRVIQVIYPQDDPLSPWKHPYYKVEYEDGDCEDIGYKKLMLYAKQARNQNS